MISSLLSLPIMLILTVIQTVAISRIKLLGGAADIILLAIVSWGISKDDRSLFFWAIIGGILISFISAMPALAVISSYFIVAGITIAFQRRLWQSPILAVLLSSFIGTIVKYFIDIIALQFMGIELDFPMSIRMTLAPNLILNLFFLFPIYLLISDLANIISPKEKEI
jgi:hypothetical protein